MLQKDEHIVRENLFQKLRPLHRFCLALLIGSAGYFILPGALPFLTRVLLAWIEFTSVYLILAWYIIFSLPVGNIKKWAVINDGSKTFVFAMIIIASIASLFAVLLIIMSGNAMGSVSIVPVSIAGMLLSWALVHTIFIFHYAHMYYGTGHGGSGLNFPGNEKPDYLDFAYFSFGIGCTFQVADVSISSKTIRRTVFLHALLSFILNTFVVALTINIISGLMK